MRKLYLRRQLNRRSLRAQLVVSLVIAIDLSKNLKCLLCNAFSDFNGLRSQALGGRKNKALGELIELIYQLTRKR
ncbi:MAG: hypothetical protein ACYTXI_42415 [Nostoc sp.]